MSVIPRAACVNDISGYGRCSLTTALPVLSVMGVQACPVPTVVLSKHSGFPRFSFHDMSDTLPLYFDTWDDLAFDIIFTGFFGSAGEIETLLRFIHRQKDNNPACYVLVDPVIGDGGRRYSTCTKEISDAMTLLIAEADLITPNITEACLLTDTPYQGEAVDFDDALEIAKKLKNMGCGEVVLTGLQREETIDNLMFDGARTEIVTARRTKSVFNGTGDLFSSVLCGALALGYSTKRSVELAAEFIRDVTDYTLRHGTPASEGLLFEPLLANLGGNIHGSNEKT